MSGPPVDLWLVVFNRHSVAHRAWAIGARCSFARRPPAHSALSAISWTGRLAGASSTSRSATSSATGWNRIARGTGSIGVLCAPCRPRYGHSMSRIVEDNPGDRRFELRVDGELVGWSEYQPVGDSVIVAHTEIDERREGEGLGSVLVRATLDQIRASGKTVIPTC